MSPCLLGAVRILLMAQAAQATVGGVVRNGETGDALEGAVVTFTDLNRSTLTGPGGRYEMLLVPPGPQHVTVRLVGHSQHTLHALVPAEGRLEINVWLRPVPVRLAAIEVRSPVEVRGTAPDEGLEYPDRAVTMASVRNHPLLAEPDVLLALGGGEVALRPESPGGMHVRGGASDQTAFQLDGVPVLNPYHAGGVFSAWNPDAVASLRLSSASRTPSRPNVLSGVVDAATLAPGERLRAQGSLGTTQARATLDGPIGSSGAGYLLSLRSSFPGILAPKGEPSYLRGTTRDVLAKLEAPLAAGRLRLLAYDSDNDLNSASASASDTSPGVASGRNEFEWHSRSLGGTWAGGVRAATVRFAAWSATADGAGLWAGDSTSLKLESRRADHGVALELERRTRRSVTDLGVRFERSRTSYLVRPDTAVGPLFSRSATSPVTSVFAQHAITALNSLTLTLGTYVALTRGRVYPGPSASLQWKAGERLRVSARAARDHQFSQSLRNAESVVGTVFPADHYLGSGADGVPTARSDLALAAVEVRPASGVRLGVQAYLRRLRGLLLVAPAGGDPFASSGGFVSGSGASRGISLEAAAGSSRFGAVMSYALSRVRYAFGDSSWVPDHGAAHSAEAGIIAFPAATFSIRIGATALIGRRTTVFRGGFEWEACNLLDQGCEFGGSPRYGDEPLGGQKLPAYFRVDAGVRKHWHVQVAGRDASIALFGTVTNLLGTRNVLTYARDPATNQLTEIEMRPLAPLVVGLDWRF